MKCLLCGGKLAYKADDLKKPSRKIYECKSCGHWFGISQHLAEDFDNKIWSVS